MGKIALLPENISNMIAAGEVVERPASVVKELVENSLDSGATQILIQIRDGGLSEIIVIDNGCGMDSADLKLSLKRFATSKISSLTDLSTLESFGFRGEALPSIAAVSEFSIKSRLASNPLGLEAGIENGQIKINEFGMPVGTSVSVINLFKNIPARLKFMKSSTTEFTHILEMINRFILIRNDVGFTLINNGKEIIKTIPNQSRFDRLKLIWGSEVLDRSLEVANNNPHLKISGTIVRPELTVSNSSKQFLYVNHRPIRDHYLSAAVKSGFGQLIMPRSYPYFALFIELPAEMVDVNVHPRKEEVAFVNRSNVFEELRQAVEAALNGIDPTYGSVGLSSRLMTNFPSSNFLTKHSYAHPNSDNRGSAQLNTFLNRSLSNQPQFDITLAPETLPEIIQIDNTYLLYEIEGGLRIVDQHAAHERINYEKLLLSFEKDKDFTNPLLIPITLALSSQLKLVTQENADILEKVGFELELSGDELIIKAIPENLKNKNVSTIVLSFLEDLAFPEGEFRNIDDASLRALTYLACRMSVKAGDDLSIQERVALVKELEHCQRPYTCPHGRPVTIELGISELEKMFKRKL